MEGVIELDDEQGAEVDGVHEEEVDVLAVDLIPVCAVLVGVQSPLAERGWIARAVITSMGDKTSPMTAAMEQAEILDLPGS